LGKALVLQARVDGLVCSAKQQTNAPTLRDAPFSAFASAEEMFHPPELQGNQRKERK
jgi:hypothetical protein